LIFFINSSLDPPSFCNAELRWDLRANFKNQLSLDKRKPIAYTNANDLHMKQHNYKKELKKVDLRATPARLAILRLLEKTKQPVDANTVINEVNKEGIKTDPATVFRIMNMLTKKGLAISVQLQEGKTRYELAEKKRHHHHLVCESCGKIEDVSSQMIPPLEEKIKSKHKFLIKRHTLEFFGLCQDCQK